MFLSSQKLFNVLYLKKYRKPGGNSNVDSKVKGTDKKIHYTSRTLKYVHKSLYINFSSQNHHTSTIGKGIGCEFKQFKRNQRFPEIIVWLIWQQYTQREHSIRFFFKSYKEPIRTKKISITIDGYGLNTCLSNYI